MQTRVLRGFAVVLLSLLCGCSTFNRDWRSAAEAPVDQTSVTGRWEGQWTSEKTRHHGALQCLMTEETNSVYRARFRATYGHAFHFTYTAHFEMHPHDTGWEFDGEANLGKLAGGRYVYEGRATTTNLVSTYRSKYDRGHFELSRK